MQSCPCSIFDVREEQILEANGSLSVRLICNMCSTELDAKIVRDGDFSRTDDLRQRASGFQRLETDDDFAMETSG